MISDFHSHAFPDSVVDNAIPALEKVSGVKAALDGTVTDLCKSMQRNNISHSVVCSIATNPKQFTPILEWSKQVTTEQIIALPSVHPASKEVLSELQLIQTSGFKGIKLHPYYQDFYIDEERLEPIFAEIARLGLFVVMHCGYDIAFPYEERANPKQLRTLISRHPDLKLVAAHLGAWKQWDEVEEHLIGENIYLDLAFVLDFLPQEQAVRMIKNHPEDKILFGSDSPWEDQKTAIQKVRNLHLGKELEERILLKNGQALLNSN